MSKTRVSGTPDEREISTSYVERQNLTMRQGIRRFTRLTNGFSKRRENLCGAVSLHFAYYNWCRVHQTLRVTPAMQAGLTDHAWSIAELIEFALTAPLPANDGPRVAAAMAVGAVVTKPARAAPVLRLIRGGL